MIPIPRRASDLPTAIRAISDIQDAIRALIAAVDEVTATIAALDLSGDGNVVGPASAVAGHLAVFGDTSGDLIADGGAAPTGTNTGDQTITLTGDVTGSGTGSFTATVARAPLGATITGATAGSVLFAGVASALAQDNANLFWDDTNNRLGIKTAAPQTNLEVVGDRNTFIMRTTNVNGFANLRIYNDLNSAVRALEIGYSGVNGDGGLPCLTNGLVGEVAYLTTTGAKRLEFGTAQTLRMFLDAAGLTMGASMIHYVPYRVGIGVASPQVPFEVLGTGALAYIRNSSSTDVAFLGILNDVNSNTRALGIEYTGSAYSTARLTGGPTGEQSVIYSRGAYPLCIGTNSVLRMLFGATNGHVSIGTATQSARLVVNNETSTDPILQCRDNGTDTFTVMDGGRVYGTALHNNAGAVTGTTNQYIASGTYTPTLTNVANVTASTANACQWTRVGNVVSVSGSLDVTPTLAALATLGISLPIASALTLATQCAGTACALGVSMPGSVSGDAANDRAQLDTVAALGANTMFFKFQYVVL